MSASSRLAHEQTLIQKYPYIDLIAVLYACHLFVCVSTRVVSRSVAWKATPSELNLRRLLRDCTFSSTARATASSLLRLPPSFIYHQTKNEQEGWSRSLWVHDYETKPWLWQGNHPAWLCQRI
ncbi:hypothetical protein SRHO_G00082950 [Serrasalmus rhombeus]